MTDKLDKTDLYIVEEALIEHSMTVQKKLEQTNLGDIEKKNLEHSLKETKRVLNKLK